ncbi:Transmembrane protein 115 [Chionoecetes opilio]|uniref:Transmembrane protein 115 n=1 Tax=Chionoecetes opilio TaxID=41210 RepID=A0A8J5CNQ5_CHIOP|nr:Transmembrane protein 115 [Chionoecetes opilio]
MWGAPLKLSHCFVEVRLWQVCVDLVTLGLCGKLIEPLWGSFEMVLFFLLVNVLCGLHLCALLPHHLHVHLQPEVLFSVQINGMAGYIAGLSVAVKQIMPDHVLLHTRTPLGKVSNRHVPLCTLPDGAAALPVSPLEGLYTTMIGCGIAVSWVYLRFYRCTLTARGATWQSPFASPELDADEGLPQKNPGLWGGAPFKEARKRALASGGHDAPERGDPLVQRYLGPEVGRTEKYSSR